MRARRRRRPAPVPRTSQTAPRAARPRAHGPRTGALLLADERRELNAAGRREGEMGMGRQEEKKKVNSDTEKASLREICSSRPKLDFQTNLIISNFY